LSELTKRILFAVPAAAIFIWITWLGGNAFQTLIFAIGLLTMWEVHRIMQQAGAGDYFTVSLIIALLIWRGAMMPDWVIVSAASVIILVTAWALIDRKRESSDRWLSTLLTGVYAPVGFLMVILIRDLGTGTEGFWLTLTLFLMIWGNDVFAYFGGKRFGKRKLAPNISPNKTWEGFWAGFIGAATGFTLAWAMAGSYPLPYWSVIGATIIISIMGPIGDILESRLKRIAGVKDSSSLLPGHGGFFDRFDSTIMTAPFLWFYFAMLTGLFSA
jgi:phosphatidate cytidylyltransferase